ncbi:MAG: hypothetical protein ACTSYL_01680 [Candidatus Thorarchaeota archaeon]
MSAETFFQRVMTTLDAIEHTPPDVLDYVELRIAIGKLREESAHENRPLTPEEDRILRQRAVAILNNDNGRIVLDLAAIIANGGASAAEFNMDTSLTVDYWHTRPDRPHPFEIVASILSEAGVFEEGETPLYYDRGRLGIRSNSARKGALIITNRRLICVGFFSGFMGRSFRICYDHWEERPWISSLDYIYLDRILDVAPRKREIHIRYHTKYTMVEEKTIGAGLYLFRFRPPDPEEIIEEDVDMHVSLDDMKGYEAPADFTVPPDYNKKRREEFLKRIIEAQSL